MDPALARDPSGERGAGLRQQLLVAEGLANERTALEQRVTLHQLSEAYIDAALEAANGRKSAAAKLLDVNRRTLYRREERLRRAAARNDAID
jgi:DNA-binding NtrC family response regulator